MLIEALSVWRVKPYIDLQEWVRFHNNRAWLLHPFHDWVVKENTHASVTVYAGNNVCIQIPRIEFEEVMYQVQEAPPLQLEPKPYLHGKRITPVDTMDYYKGVWQVEFVEGLEGRYGEAINGYRLTQNGSTVCTLDTSFVHNCFVEVQNDTTP